MADDRLLSKAIEILQERDPRGRMSLDVAKETLAEYSPFEDMDDEDLAPIAGAAFTKHGETASSRRPAPVTRGGGPTAKLVETRDPPDAAMLTAPYRFVAIDDRVVPAQPEIKTACWSFPIKGGFSGDIEVEWAFETPMLIGVETKDANGKDVSAPMKLGDDYVIPGATLRGMTRAAMGIVCRARLMQINAHHRYGVRDFTHPLFKEGQGAGAQRLAWDRLGAGWLRKKLASEAEKSQGLSDYVLTPCDKKIVRIRALPASFNDRKPTDNGQWHRDWLGLKLDARYEKAGYVKERRGRIAIFDFENIPPIPFSSDPLARAGDPTAKDHVIPGGGGVGEGWFVFSNNSPSLRDITAATLDAQDGSPRQGDQKKREYVFFDRAGATEIRLTQEAFDRFVLINSKPGKTKPKPDGSYAVMAPSLEAGWRIPVFYAGDPEGQSGDFDMGLTRLFKLSHKFSVGNMLARQAAHERFIETEEHKRALKDPDMVEVLFGYVYDRADFKILPGLDLPEGAARKGRVTFGFAKLLDRASAAETGVATTVAMAPRASYAPFYLRRQIKDWSAEESDGVPSARLAGRKRYFPRFPMAPATSAEKAILDTLAARNNPQAADTQSKLRLLKPRATGGELVFSGTICARNVTGVEVGALLWTLTHGGDPKKPYRHMIGRAKNSGAGQARVKSVKLELIANDESGRDTYIRKDLDPRETQGVDGGWTTRGGQSLGPFLQAFEAYMKKEADPAWPQVDDVLEFLGTSDATLGAKLKADFLPTPNDHGKLRRLVQADFRNDPAPVGANDRLLPAPRARQLATSTGSANLSGSDRSDKTSGSPR